MNFDCLIRFGYTLVIGTFLLMVWVSYYVGAKELESVRHPPCYFNPLCSCSRAMPDLGLVRCKNFQLLKIPFTINSSKVFMLSLDNIGLRTIEPYFLQSTGLYKLSVTRNPIYVVPDEAFMGLERSLWELDLSNNYLTIVPSKAIRYLQKLKYLDLRGNDISVILPDNWRGLENSLEKLILADNSLRHLPMDGFSGLPHLDTLDLSGNSLREIDPSVFRDGMGKLAHLIFTDNQLTAIPYLALAPLNTLRTLDLSSNLITAMKQPIEAGSANVHIELGMSLDELRLDHNQIATLDTGDFEHFDILNATFLDGNPIASVEAGAFRPARIRELYLRRCNLATISPAAFEGLEGFLERLDLSGNKITSLPQDIFHGFNSARFLSLGDNMLTGINPTEHFNGFQYTLHDFDFTGPGNAPISIHDLRRFRNLRSLKLGKLSSSHLSREDFLDFGTNLEELHVNYASLQSVKNNAFQSVQSLKILDLSENSIGTIENDAFVDVGHSLVHLSLSRGLSSSVQSVPQGPLRALENLELLDLSNNKFRTLPDTAFHFLKKLKELKLQDNEISHVPKGTFQGDIHTQLETIYLSFNGIKTINQHTFSDLPALQQLHMDDNAIVTLERRSFINLDNLRRLNLKGNKISVVSFETFQNLPQLENLDLSYNQLSDVQFSMFDQVGTLSAFCVNISHNKISDLSLNLDLSFGGGTGVNYHANIKNLDISYNKIGVIHKQYFRPVEISLTHLHLSHNTIMNATRDAFGNMPHLNWIDLSHNRIYDFEYDTFRNTKNLQVFLASHNYIAELPKELFRPTHQLRVVDLSNNRLRFLPDNLFREEGLELLDVSNNQLTRLPLSSLSSGAASSLCEFDLSSNTISSVTNGDLLAKFKSLQALDLSNNRLVQIDGGTFTALHNLLQLDLSNNYQLGLEGGGYSFVGVDDCLLSLNLDNTSLTYVPDLPLQNLLSLSLSHNFLASVPPDIAINLTSLRTLNLDNNDLSAVPIVTHSLEHLKRLSLAGNSIATLTNTSLLGAADRLEELDLRNLQITNFETGALNKMFYLKTLKMSVYTNIRDFNIPRLIQCNTGIRSLEIVVNKDTDLGAEMKGDLPPKVKHITLTGNGLKVLSEYVLQGVRSPTLRLSVQNTSLSRVSLDVFKNLQRVQNISVDLFNNPQFQNLDNPSTGGKPGLSGKTFLTEISMGNNQWKCNCDLGWVEVWQRKRRQYLCGKSPSDTPFFTDHDYTCRHADDDLRTSLCANKANQTVIDVLKNEIECGWSSAPTGGTVNICLLVMACLKVVQYLL